MRKPVPFILALMLADVTEYTQKKADVLRKKMPFLQNHSLE